MSQYNDEGREVSFSEITSGIKDKLSRLNDTFFDGFLFIKRNLVLLCILLIGGVVAGYFIDKNSKIYSHDVMVFPNFGSVDYLYSKIELINSRLRENDTVFLNSIGIKNHRNITKIEIEAINDVYNFVSERPTNFELLKLLAEDNDLNQIIEDKSTGRNFSSHRIIITTHKAISRKNIIEPLLNYLNDSQHYNLLKAQTNANIDIKMKANDSIIKQIDGIIESFSRSEGQNSVYFSKDMQLNEIIKSKEALVGELGILKISKVNNDAIIKETSTIMNIVSRKGIEGKIKFLLPLAFVAFFIIIVLIKKYYNLQISKRKTLA